MNITIFQTRISTDEGIRNTTQARIKTVVVNSNSERNNKISGATIIKTKGHTLLVLPPIEVSVEDGGGGGFNKGAGTVITCTLTHPG